MGQYHKLVNVDRKEYVDPHSIGLGVKQWEHQSHPDFPIAGSLSDVLYILTMTSPARGGGDMPPSEISGRWVADRVMVLGDYTENDDIPLIITYKGEELENRALYHYVDEHYTEIGEQVREAMTAIYGYSWSRDKYGWSRSLKKPELV